MKVSSNGVLKVLGVVLLVAAVLKGWQLLTEPVANSDIWSYRPFLILTVELELALSIWLLSGLFKKAAWLAALVCFSFFSIITLYKAVTGAASCGCFVRSRSIPGLPCSLSTCPRCWRYRSFDQNRCCRPGSWFGSDCGTNP